LSLSKGIGLGHGLHNLVDTVLNSGSGYWSWSWSSSQDAASGEGSLASLDNRAHLVTSLESADDTSSDNSSSGSSALCDKSLASLVSIADSATFSPPGLDQNAPSSPSSSESLASSYHFASGEVFLSITEDSASFVALVEYSDNS